MEKWIRSRRKILKVTKGTKRIIYNLNLVYFYVNDKH